MRQCGRWQQVKGSIGNKCVSTPIKLPVQTKV
jgi:hypothetical protein